MPKKAKAEKEETKDDDNDGPAVKERLHLTRCEYTTILYIVNSALNNFAYPDPATLDHSPLIGIAYQKDRSALGSMNFIFSSGKTELETYGQDMEVAMLLQIDNRGTGGGKEKPYAKIKHFKPYVEPRTYGEKLCGIRCYDKEDNVVLQAGWFDPSFLICKRVTLADNEVIWGIESYTHFSTPGVHYDAIFRIREAQ